MENKFKTNPARSDLDVQPLDKRNGLELGIRKRNEKTLGKVITQTSSVDLIEGVVLHPLAVLPDDRGFFAEVARLGAPGIAELMTTSQGQNIQVSTTLTYPGTIKAIHYHYEQTDLWAPMTGMFQVCLCDFRVASGTFGRINTLYVGQYRPWEILIPPGVGHGYKVLGTQPAQLIYLTNRFYNPSDEGRLAYDHPDVAYDWEMQHK